MFGDAVLITGKLYSPIFQFRPFTNSQTKLSLVPNLKFIILNQQKTEPKMCYVCYPNSVTFQAYIHLSSKAG